MTKRYFTPYHFRGRKKGARPIKMTVEINTELRTI